MIPFVVLTLTAAAALIGFGRRVTDAAVQDKKQENVRLLIGKFPSLSIVAPPADAPELYLDPQVAAAAQAGHPWAKMWGRYTYQLHKDDLPPLQRR